MRKAEYLTPKLEVTDFPSAIEWSFAKDAHVEEGGICLSYDDLESRDEGDTHRWLRRVAKESLEELEYLVYDAGVGIRGHNSFCDGAAKRDSKFVLYEALRRWALLDDDQLFKKLEFARHCNLLLVTTFRDRKVLKMRVDRLAADYNFPIVFSYPVKGSDGRWRLHCVPNRQISAVAMFHESSSYKLEIDEKTTWADFKFRPSGPSEDYFFLYHVKSLFFEFFGQKGGTANPRSKCPGEFIIRNDAKEVARFRVSMPMGQVEAMISGRLRRTELPAFIDLIKNEAAKGEVTLEIGAASGSKCY
ncbi:hypothetical protein SAMN05216369_2826 [Marinobacter antarcticus]|uniref:Uncharacterized protein n=1 Tax=Marinobacter antarcticus TaxID=564117 RepID=A0A1M6UH47_9GAMM|nr:hypothetical protein [Marinobacter antarcticus]SHK68491.1 hypothetical protein SAMN05216369_2826 [Marinobacter antarcticus]